MVGPCDEATGGLGRCEDISWLNAANCFLPAVMKTSACFGLRKVWNDTKTIFDFESCKISAGVFHAGAFF